MAILFHDVLDANNVCSTKPAASIESHRIRPELCNAFLSLHMNMRWLMSIRGIEEESVWSIAQDSRKRLQFTILGDVLLPDV